MAAQPVAESQQVFANRHSLVFAAMTDRNSYVSQCRRTWGH